ncbi:MAG: glycoside hydrolase [Candidatus Omnitrophica bacterium]|nr:glycoside hydrolase [Candidatus Omnitrophota bacterium]
MKTETHLYLRRLTINSRWEKYVSGERRFQGIPGIEQDRRGHLWATWYGGGQGEGPENFVVLVVSEDNGITWSEPVAVVDPPGKIRAFDPCLWRDPTGKLWWFWAESYSEKEGEIFDGRGGVWATVFSHEEPEALSFSQPRKIANGVMLNKPIVLSTGEWLLPTAVWEYWPVKDESLARERFSNATISQDGGVSFQRRGGADVAERCFDEHMFIELKNGRLWCLVRTLYGIGQSFSSDRGYTWSGGEDSGLGGPNSRFFIRRLRSGNILLINHADISPQEALKLYREGKKWRPRSHLTAFLSLNDGLTWQGGLLLDERVGVSYPDGTEIEDGSIYIIYDRDRSGAGEILLSGFREEDVLEGKLVSPGAFLKRVVSRLR